MTVPAIEWPYSILENPHLPIAHAQIGKAWSYPGMTCQLELDTGSFITAIPIEALEKFRAKKIDISLMEDCNGRQFEAQVYEVSIEVAGKMWRWLRVIGLPHPRGFLGRDILNAFMLELDGPKVTTRIRN